MNTDEEFGSITDNIISDEANELLDKQLARVLQWRDMCVADGEMATLAALIHQMVNERAPRIPTVVTHATALWRLLEKDGKL